MRRFILLLLYASILGFTGCNPVEENILSDNQISTEPKNNPITPQIMEYTVSPNPEELTNSVDIQLSEKLPKFPGRIILGNISKGSFYVIDFEKNSLVEKPIPSGCIPINLRKAICGLVNESTSISIPNITVYDLENRNMFPEIPGPFKSSNLSISPIMNVISIIRANKNEFPEMIEIGMNSGEIQNEMPINPNNWLSLPKYSELGIPYIGLSTKRGNGFNISKWYPIGDKTELIYSTDEYTIPGDFSRSSDGNHLLIPAWENEPTDIPDYFDDLLLFSMDTNKMIALQPPKNFHFPIQEIPSNLWSPNSQKFAVEGVKITDNNWNRPEGGICFFDISTINNNCISGINGGVSKIAWSPDSKYLAILSRDGDLIIIDTSTNIVHNIGKSKSLGSLGSFPIWSP
jgi:WD40 repeat protein